MRVCRWHLCEQVKAVLLARFFAFITTLWLHRQRGILRSISQIFVVGPEENLHARDMGTTAAQEANDKMHGTALTSL
jgi:hypothetical protein